MRSLWRHKWLVVVGSLTIFMSIGAVAWAVGDDATPAGATLATQCGVVECAADTVQQEQPAGARPGAALREAMKERREERLQRHAALMNALRGDMSPEDQAGYDALVAEAKEKREALQEARQDLADTLKRLRELTDKYLDLGDTGSTQ